MRCSPGRIRGAPFGCPPARSHRAQGGGHHLLPYNDLDAAAAVFASAVADIACVIHERRRQHGAVAPLPDFNAGLHALTPRTVLCGDRRGDDRFRVSGPAGRPGGSAGVLYPFGKVSVRRLPRPRSVAAPPDVPAGPGWAVYRPARFGNPLAVATGLATLRAADDACTPHWTPMRRAGWA